MDDLISRKATIDKINERQRKLIYCFGFENDAVKIMDIAKSIVIAMPSVQAESCDGCKWENAFWYGECYYCRRRFGDRYEVEADE